MKLDILASALALALCGLQDVKPATPEPLQVGAAAPVFRLNDHNGIAEKIGAEREQWTVLAFYPKALTPG